MFISYQISISEDQRIIGANQWLKHVQNADSHRSNADYRRFYTYLNFNQRKLACNWRKSAVKTCTERGFSQIKRRLPQMFISYQISISADQRVIGANQWLKHLQNADFHKLNRGSII